MRVVCVYVPNGQSLESDKYQYKLGWLEALAIHLQTEIASFSDLAVLGDFNIAPDDRDVYDPKAWAGQVLCSDAERAALKRLLALGFCDSFRAFEQPDKSFTWWDYRMNGFRRNFGLRIDHVLLTQGLQSACEQVMIDLLPRKSERPSDHAPVIAALRS